MNIKPAMPININQNLIMSQQNIMSSPKINQNFKVVSYTTADGGLFIGYYLNTKA